MRGLVVRLVQLKLASFVSADTEVAPCPTLLIATNVMAHLNKLY